MQKPNYFLRRDMEHGLVVLVGEDKDEPYAAVVKIVGPRGHVLLIMKRDGQFGVEIHPDGGEPLPILGLMDMFTAVVNTVGEMQVGQSSKPRMN